MKIRELLAAVLLAATHSAFAAQYSVIDLGTLGGNQSVAFGINDNAQVVGQSALSSGLAHAFLYSNGVMTDLGTLGGAYSIAHSINASGQVVGSSLLPGNGESRGFLYSNGFMTPLGQNSSAGIGSYEALGINASGQIVGDGPMSSYNVTTHAFLRDSNGVMTDLGTVAGVQSYAWGINDTGNIVGHSLYPDGYYHAVLYSNGSMTDLGTLGGRESFGRSINASGQVVGDSYISGNTFQHAFLYSGGAMTDLGTLGGGNSYGWSINASGQVVGRSDLSIGCCHAFLYSNGSMTDLNNLIDPQSGWTIIDANAINTQGDIAAYGFNAAGEGRALLLTAAPVPAPLPILGAVAALGWSRKLRRRIKDAQAQAA